MELGDYAKVNDDPSPTNSMKSRARIVLGLEPQVNIQCSYKFLGMTTGKKPKKRAWKPMPMPDAIIKRVEYLASQNSRSGRSGIWRLRK